MVCAAQIFFELLISKGKQNVKSLSSNSYIQIHPYGIAVQ